MKQTIGQRISEARRRLKLTQENMAESLGVSAQAVSKWENDISCPDIALLPELAKILGMTTDELLSGKKEAPAATVVPEEERKEFNKLMLCINVISSGGDKVKVNIPMPLVKALLESGVSLNSIGGEKLESLNIDWSNIMSMAEHGGIGKLIEIESADGDTVEIVVE